MKTLLRLFLLFVVAVGVTLVVMWWLNRGKSSDVLLAPIEITEAREAVARLASQTRRREVRLDAAMLRRLLIVSLADSRSGRAVLENAAGVRASIGDGKIEAGVVLSTVGLEEKLENAGDEKLDRLAAILDWLPGDGLFVGAMGVPIVRDGALIIDTATLELQIGPLSISPEDLAEKIDLSSDGLAEELRLGIEGVRFESVRVEGETLVVGVL